MKSSLKYALATAIFSTTLLSGQAAFADDMVGTWNGNAIDTDVITDLSFTVLIEHEINPAQMSNCRSIQGTMTQNTRTGRQDGTIQGYHCPDGAFAFIFNRIEDGATMQLFRGNLDANGNVSTASFIYISGDWGEYQFSASK